MSDLNRKVSGHLQLRGTKGKRQWHAFLRVDGQRRHKVLAPAHAKDSAAHRTRRCGLASGERFEALRRAPHAKGSPGRARRAARGAGRAGRAGSCDKTLRDAWEEWLRHIEFDRNRKSSTVRDYRSQTRRYLLDELGADLPLHELTTERIEEWQQELLERGELARRARTA